MNSRSNGSFPLKNTVKYQFQSLYAVNCKFKNCTHINEPGCDVIVQLNNNVIARSRYDSYLSMLKKNTNYRKTNY